MRLRYFIITTTLITLLTACGNVNNETVESSEVESTTEIEIMTTVEETTIEETSTIEETEISTEVVLEDGVTFYDYGYVIANDVVINVDENLIVSINSTRNNSDFYKNRFDVYYWVDKNTRIQDSTSSQLKEGVPAFIYTRNNFDGRWDYIFLFDENNTLVHSDYELRILNVEYVKDGEKLQERFILCLPKNALFLRESLEVGNIYKNRLMLKSKDNEHSLHVDLEGVLLGNDPDTYCISDDIGWECMLVPYNKFLKDYELYNNLMQFYLGARVEVEEEVSTEEESEVIDYNVNCPLGAEEFNLLIIDQLTNNLEQYINSVIAGRFYKYVIFTVDGTVYETVAASDRPIDEYSIDYEGYAVKEVNVVIDNIEDRRLGICDYSEFINNPEVSLELISNIFSE